MNMDACAHDIECPVCFNDTKDRIMMRMPCQHEFCFNCFANLVQKQCVMCRADLSPFIPEMSQDCCTRGMLTVHFSHTPADTPNAVQPSSRNRRGFMSLPRLNTNYTNVNTRTPNRTGNFRHRTRSQSTPLVIVRDTGTSPG